MASRAGNSEEIGELKLRTIGTYWFLDTGGKLKRLSILDNAKNVSMLNNVIFAGDKLYQVCTSDNSDIVVNEIEDVRANTSTAQTIKGNSTLSNINTSDNVEISGSTENAPNNAGTNDESCTVVNETGDVCGNSSYDTETGFDRSDTGKSVRSAGNVPNNVLSSSDDTSLCAFVTNSERNNESSSDSEADYNLERGQDEYIAQTEKGIFRGIFRRLNKAVKRKPGERQKTLYKKEEQLYEDVPYDGRKSVSSNIGSEMEDEVNYEDMIYLSTNIDEVQGAKLVTALYDFEAFQDDEISFRKNDRFKVYGKGNSSNSEWCSAEHLRTGKKGYIPWAYVTNNMSSLESIEWWFNVDAYAAEQLLLLSGFPPGTFLLRPASVLPLGTSMCALSMLYRDSVSDSTRVAHYRIRQHMGRVFISANREFKSISELLDFYKGKLFDTLDVTVAQLATEKMTLEEFREASAVLRNFRDSKAKIVRMIAVSLEPESYLIVLGETIHCTLKELLKTNGKIKLNFRLLFQYAAQVADGMAFLEKKNVVHGYLRADCVFVCYPYAAKIAHPKLHELISGAAGNRPIQDLCETDEWKWTAPEAIYDERKYCVKSDVWSYGILLYELITFGEEPYNGLTAEEALSLLEGGTRLQRPVPCPLEYYVTMLKCWHKHPECRPTFEFLRELFLDFENIESFEIGSKDGDDDISLKKGDVITDVEPIDEGWWKGTTPDGKRGMFPSNYVEVLEARKKPKIAPKPSWNGKHSKKPQEKNSEHGSDLKHLKKPEEKTTGPESDLKHSKKPKEKNSDSDDLYIEMSLGKESDSHPLVKTPELPKCRGFSAKALYDYVAERDDEISICEDDILTDIDPVEVGRWKGTAPDGKRGMFPSSFVEVFEDYYAEIVSL